MCCDVTAQADRVNSVLAKARKHYLHYVIHDRLSRYVSATDLYIDASKEYDTISDHSLLSMLRLCDPDAALDDITAHTQQLLVQ
jgi:hypothetical protein